MERGEISQYLLKYICKRKRYMRCQAYRWLVWNGQISQVLFAASSDHVSGLHQLAWRLKARPKTRLYVTSICCTQDHQIYELSEHSIVNAGMAHPGISCGSCNQHNILGMRWQCTGCPDFNLCTPCYFSGEHDLDHQFLRIDRKDDSMDNRYMYVI